MTLWIGFLLGVAITCLIFVWVHIRELWSDIDCIRRDMERRHKTHRRLEEICELEDKL